MSIRFQTFRRLLLGLIALISSTCIIFVVYLGPSFHQRSNFWMIVCVEGFTALASSWSALRKIVFKSPQLVASEALGLISQLPFQLILALVLLLIPKLEPVSVFSGLQILAFINTGLLFTYAGCLIIITTLTVHAFDREAWHRDIDASPSPFPMPILFAFVFPCLSRSSPSPFTPVFTHPIADQQPPLCLPGCNCSTKPPLVHSPQLSLASSGGHEQGLPGQDQTFLSGSNSLSRSLVRIPDAAERRSSIVIAFEV